MTTNPGAVPLPSGTLDDVFTRWSVPECARAEIRQAVAALMAKQAQSGRAARELHHEVTEMFLRPECGSEECDHEDGCPDDNPVQVCAGCWEQLEAADAYIFERPAACEQVRWPCATIRALDGAS